MSATPRQMADRHRVETDDYEERAAILEYEAADFYPTRAEAERMARQMVEATQARMPRA